jgi:type IV secretory pathway VirD2 relaxase
MSTEPTNRRDAIDREDAFRPKMGRRRPPAPERVPTFRAQLARAIAKQGGRKKGVGRAASKLGRVAVRAPHALSRRCVIKARYVPMTGNGRKLAKAHLAYLERDGVERDGSPGRLYGPDQNFDADTVRAPMDGEPRQFRFIVSPEDAHLLDLAEFTRQLMKQVEKDTGRRLDWAAVNHHNTDNPHVHIVVRGLDRDGDEVRIDGRYIAQEMRWRAQEIVTRELGRRPELELSRTRNPEIEWERFTNIDRAIEALATPERTISLQRILGEPGGDGRVCIARLQTLETLGLVKNEQPSMWRLEPEWQQALRDLGERQDVHDRLRPLVGNRAIGFQIVDERNPVPPFEGRVIGKGLDDELGGGMFVAIQTPGGDAFYLRVAPNIAEPLRAGDTLRVGFDAERWVKPADRIVARFAEDNGGVYDPARHQRALEILQRSRLPLGGPTPAERVAANLRRLERLERYQLVARLPNGRWQIRPDLVSQLEDRERTHPQPRMSVERIGPERTSPSRDNVRGPERAAPPRDNVPDLAKELAALGQALAKQHRDTYVSEPTQFRGRAVDCSVTQSGREYSRVVNYARGEFTLIPKPPEWERLRGHTITLARDREQKLVVQLDRGLSR